MTLQNPSRSWIVASAMAACALSTAGCKSDAIHQHQHGAPSLTAPTTSSAVSDQTTSLSQQGSTAYDAGVKQVNHSYDDVNKLAGKAADDLKAGAGRAKTDVVDGLRQNAAQMRQGAAKTVQGLGKSAQAATDEVIDPSTSSSATSDPIVLPDPSAGQP